MNFRSDNEAPVAPEILAAIAAANDGFAPSYGADAITRRLDGLFSELFEREVAVLPVATGTAANGLALAISTSPMGAVFCHRDAHIETDECGAPEFFTGGAKLFGMPGPLGRIDPEALRASIGRLRKGNPHQVQPAAVSITQATEWGTVYTPDEVRVLTDIAKAHDMRVHMDGARFAHAVAALGVSPAAATWQAGVDVLSFGATKNGAMAAEAVIVFDPPVAEDFPYRRKRAGHLLSKMRYVAAQLEAYVADGLWLRLARAANDKAGRLAAALAETDGIALAAPCAANAVFAVLPETKVAAMAEAGAQFHRWPFGEAAPGMTTIRLVTSYATPEDDIDAFIALARKV